MLPLSFTYKFIDDRFGKESNPLFLQIPCPIILFLFESWGFEEDRALKMAFSMEILGCSLSQRTLLPSSSSPLFRAAGEQSSLRFLPVSERRICLARRAVRPPVVATMVMQERAVSAEAEEKPVRFKVRAAVTVRRKKKEDFKEAATNQFDAFFDKMGKNVVLELISANLDRSEFFFFLRLIWSHFCSS